MPMYDSLADQIKYFLLNGGDYHVAPDLGADVLDAVDAFGARFLDYREHERHAHVLWDAHCWLMDCWWRWIDSRKSPAPAPAAKRHR